MTTDSKTVPPTEIIVVLGCGNRTELADRMDTAATLFRDIKDAGSFPYIFASGTSDEYTVMKKWFTTTLNIDWEFMGENRSRDTIDNIINSFNDIHSVKHSIQYYYSDNQEQSCDAGPFNRLHIVSSAYHLRRVRLIIETLGLKSERIRYYGSLVYDPSRLETEYAIESNYDYYVKSILKRKPS